MALLEDTVEELAIYSSPPAHPWCRAWSEALEEGCFASFWTLRLPSFPVTPLLLRHGACCNVLGQKCRR